MSRSVSPDSTLSPVPPDSPIPSRPVAPTHMSSSATSSSGSATLPPPVLPLPVTALPPPVSSPSVSDVPKLSYPLSCSNYHDWRRDVEMLLALRDYDIDEPEPHEFSEASRWRKVQRHILAILHLNCEPKQARLFRSARTGKQAWDILASRFASNSAPNVMRLEESFGTARQGDDQSMTDWLAHLENLAEELSSVGVDISDIRLANRLVGGLAPRYDSIKQALRARSDGPSLAAVREHLLSYELEASVHASKNLIPASSPSVSPVPPPFYIPRPYAHNNTHRGPMATAMLHSNPCPVHPTQPCLCLPASATASPPTASSSRAPPSSFRFSPYPSPYSSHPSLICHACGKDGHTHNRCWLLYPHLRPQEPIRRFPDPYGYHHPGFSLPSNPILPPPGVLQPFRSPPTDPRFRSPPIDPRSLSQPRSTFPAPVPGTANLAIHSPTASPLESQQSPDGPYVFHPLPAVDQQLHQPPPDNSYSFAGPDSTVSPHDYSHAFVSVHQALSPLEFRSTQYCLSSRLLSPSLGGIDEPGKWLIDSGASSHFSPFRHLFLSLSPCVPPVRILTGSGYLTAEFHGPIPLLIKGHDDAVVQLILQNVLYIPDLQSRVNLFSVVVLADKNIHSTFGPYDVQFFLDGSLLASGTRIGNSWWLNADVRSHDLYHAAHALSMAPRNTTDTLSTWHKQLGHLNHRDIGRLQTLATGLSIGKPPVPSCSGACTGCLIGKQHRDISRIPHSPKKRLARVHIDICGPMQVEGVVAKHLYNAVFVDEAIRFTHSYCIVHKSDIRDSVLNYIALVERETGDSVLALFSDNEGALLQKDFQELLHQRGIAHYTTQSYSAEMNRIAENANKQIRSKSLLPHVGASNPPWFLARSYSVCYLPQEPLSPSRSQHDSFRVLVWSET